jgi:hypothetical protein
LSIEAGNKPEIKDKVRLILNKAREVAHELEVKSRLVKDQHYNLDRSPEGRLLLEDSQADFR